MPTSPGGLPRARLGWIGPGSRRVIAPGHTTTLDVVAFVLGSVVPSCVVWVALPRLVRIFAFRGDLAVHFAALLWISLDLPRRSGMILWVCGKRGLTQSEAAVTTIFPILFEQGRIPLSSIGPMWVWFVFVTCWVGPNCVSSGLLRWFRCWPRFVVVETHRGGRNCVGWACCRGALQAYSEGSQIKEPTFLAWGKPVSYLGTLSVCMVSKGNPFKLVLGRGDSRRVDLGTTRADLGASFLFQGFLNKGPLTVVIDQSQRFSRKK